MTLASILASSQNSIQVSQVKTQRHLRHDQHKNRQMTLASNISQAVKTHQTQKKKVVKRPWHKIFQH